MTIFDVARIRFSELYNDAINFISSSYDDIGQSFTMASPMGQLLQVILHLDRINLFYIEDSITELNINTATRPQSIKGISTITGHNPSRAIGARGTLRLTYNNTKLNITGNTIIIPQYTQLLSTITGLNYTIVLPGQEVYIDMTSSSYVDVDIIQGIIEYQQATGTGDPLQSFNFQPKKGATIDNYFVNVYVDGTKWDSRDSILDMGYNEQSVMIRTGATGGIDIFFGNGYNGAVPRMGSTILVEYMTTDGESGNISSIQANNINSWIFKTNGFALNGEVVDLNKVINISTQNDILFGTGDEPLYLTRLLAPHVSRSFVLANTENYIYFLRKLNLFTIIDAIPGFATYEDQYALTKYTQANSQLFSLNQQYTYALSTYGSNAKITTDLYNQKIVAQNEVNKWKQIMESQKKDDNTVYLFVIPDVTKRISASQNYYTCSLDSFKLTDNEKAAILNLIEESGQRIMTVDNAFLEIKYPLFSLNISLIIYENADINTIRENIIANTSEYFLKNTRRDRLPLSDIIRIIENIDGVDSVNAFFDADVNNKDIYNDGTYGIDDFGDIILQRNVIDAYGNPIPVKDIYALVRGNFTSFRGIVYEDGTAKDKVSSINIQVRGITRVDLNTKNNQAIVGGLSQ